MSPKQTVEKKEKQKCERAAEKCLPCLLSLRELLANKVNASAEEIGRECVGN
jgi:hypothetical protein